MDTACWILSILCCVLMCVCVCMCVWVCACLCVCVCVCVCVILYVSLCLSVCPSVSPSVWMVKIPQCVGTNIISAIHLYKVELTCSGHYFLLRVPCIQCSNTWVSAKWTVNRCISLLHATGSVQWCVADCFVIFYSIRWCYLIWLCLCSHPLCSRQQWNESESETVVCEGPINEMKEMFRQRWIAHARHPTQP